MEKITSQHNGKIKNLIKLAKAKERKKQSLIIVEGARAMSEALKAKIEIKQFFYCPELDNQKKNQFKLAISPILVSREVFLKIAYAENPDGYLALVEAPKTSLLPSLKVKADSLFLVLESLEKPGNLGAILRSAYAAKVEAIIINDPKVDIYNPNVVRASEGLLFANKVVLAGQEESLSFFEANGVKTLATSLKASRIYTEIDFKRASAIIIGSEAQGLGQFWLKRADERIKIPMRPGMDSLNASVSAAVVIFEAWRQRGFH